MKDYETTLIFDPQILDEGWDKAVQKYSAIIEADGTIKRTDRWGLRRLTYPIQKQQQGYYVQFVHNSPPETPRQIERQCLLDEQCFRYMTVVSDNPRYLEEQDKRSQARDAMPSTPSTTSPKTDDGEAQKIASTGETTGNSAPQNAPPAADQEKSDQTESSEKPNDAPAPAVEHPES